MYSCFYYVCVCLCSCMCVHMCICMHVFMCIIACVYVFMCMYVLVCVYVYACMCVLVCMCLYVCLCVYVEVRANSGVAPWNILCFDSWYLVSRFTQTLLTGHKPQGFAFLHLHSTGITSTQHHVCLELLFFKYMNSRDQIQVLMFVQWTLYQLSGLPSHRRSSFW